MIYAILTGLYILCFCGKIENFVWLLTNRLIIIGFVTLFAFWHNKTNNSFVFFLRFIFPPTLTSYWYPETYYLNDDVLVKNLDKFFADLDLQLFGFEPSLEFSAHYSQAWVSESMYFGYFSYFLIFAYVGIGFFLYKKNEALPVMFSIITSFFIFYLIFIFVPAAGPQFYYPASDVQVPDGYLFCNLMRSIQESGEKPTGAFPSSHVGMTLIFLYILFKHARKIFWITLPVACLLIMSTVYIKAHYLVDVLAAFLCTPFIYMASNKLYSKLL
ncbi:MAG: phosphatase PAP2 family protein [Prevotellaceae bacterium]|jgi:membrane-associated phospholipid phosphatase|nr:phosphatase PAP2 family protein [Prevotellaceae bacterium]